MVELVKKSADASSFKTVHFIWMQGESDAGRDLGAAYERSFKVMIERLKKEIGIETMYFVIGRISDFLANLGNLHYTPEESVKLGASLGEAALKQLAEAK